MTAITNRAGSGSVLLAVAEEPLGRAPWHELARDTDSLVTFDGPGGPVLPERRAVKGDGYDD